MDGVKYVVTTATAEYDSVGEDSVLTYAMQPPVLCGSRAEAEAALQEWMEEHRGAPDDDWSVFEVVDGRCSHRAITFEEGGALKIRDAGA